MSREYFVKEEEILRGLRKKLLIIMVGLPARGKTYLSLKIATYLEWLGYNAKVFNVGEKRRELLANTFPQDFYFFDTDNEQYRSARDQVAMEVLENCISWLKSGEGHIAIHDGTNSTKNRRDLVLKRLEKEHNIRYIFLESICNDKEIIERNILSKTKSPDYNGKDLEFALDDFKKRLELYNSSYQTLSSTEDNMLSYIKFIDVGRTIINNRVKGYLCTLISNFLLHYNISETKTIFISRHGESIDNTLGLLGGDTSLSEKGEIFASALTQFVKLQESLDSVPVFTSTLKRTKETARFLDPKHRKYQFKGLNELNAGIFEGKTYKLIEEKNKDEFEARQKDKLRYRYPMGESYVDLINRVNPIALELEREKRNILVVSHQALLRTVLGYFIHVPLSEIPYLEIPLHTVIQLKRSPNGCEETRYSFDLNAFKNGEPIFWKTETICHIIYTLNSFHHNK